MRALFNFIAAGLLLLAACAGIFHMGQLQERAVWDGKQAKAERAAAARYDAEVKRGDAAVADYITSQEQHTRNYQQLERRFHELRKTVPLIAQRSVTTTVTVSTAGVTATQIVLVPLPGGTEHLSLGAVWMWNSALTGTDTPAGACGAADTTEQACAAPAGITLDDAWANQAANARTCAADRARYQHLIDFLNGRTP